MSKKLEQDVPRPNLILQLALTDQKIAYWSHDQTELADSNDRIVAELHARNHTRPKPHLKGKRSDGSVLETGAEYLIQVALEQQSTARVIGDDDEAAVAAGALLKAQRASEAARTAEQNGWQIDK